MNEVQENEQQFYVEDIAIFKTKMLNWANTHFSIFCFLDSCGYAEKNSAFNWVLAAGTRSFVSLSSENAAADINNFLSENEGWKFGHLGYDLKNQFENLASKNKTSSGFGPGFLFIPQVLIKSIKDSIIISSEEVNAKEIFAQIWEEEIPIYKEYKIAAQSIPSTITKEKYLAIIKKLQEHIQQGDCYEINFCRYHEARNFKAQPIQLFIDLIKQSPVPFAALYKNEEHFCICASPERFIKKTGNTIISQPIKGTARRILYDEVKDKELLHTLKESEKNKSENVMVTDLVRNDLSRICVAGSVQVSELFGLHSFPLVHHMISTVQGQLKDNIQLGKILQATFPMGSMTGAPKKKVMELIDEYETKSRGLFSGSIGYIDPDGNFDFNVVIRSIFYDAKQHHLSFYAGGAITIYSNAEEEWDECELKTAAIKKVLSGA